MAAYKRLLDEQPGNSLLLWHMGRAQVALADDLREKSNYEQALGAYGDAAETFLRYHARNPRYADNTNHWLAICNLSARQGLAGLG